MNFITSSRLVRRFSVFALALLLTSFISMSAETKTASAAGPVVNVPAAILYVGCSELLARTVSVDFYYVRLDGSVAVRTATIDNGGLTYNTGAPTVQFYQVSIDYRNTNALYEFNLDNGQYYDVYVGPRNWGRDQRNGNIFSTFQC